MGHLVLHKDCIAFISTVRERFYEKTDEDRRRLHTMEVQADIYAVSAMFDEVKDEHDRYLRFLAAIIAHLSEFYLRNLPA